MFRLVPPAGTPFDCRMIASAAKALGSRDSVDAALSSFAGHVGARYAFGVSSGRAALAVILLALHRLRRQRNVVVLPAYTCFSVPAAAVRAGLKLRLVDIDPETLDFDFPQLEAALDGNVLCVVTANLFGFASDARRLREMTRAHNICIVDDAAQSFGALRYGHFSGTLGDVGFYSLGRGKPLAGEGGIIVTDSDELATAIRKELDLLPRPSWTLDATRLVKLMATAILSRPRLYWVPAALPFLRLGTTKLAPSFPLRDIAPVSCALLRLVLERVRELQHVRVRNAYMLAAGLQGNSAFRTPAVGPDCEPNYLRFPVLAPGEEIRNQAINELRRAGVGASPFYPSAICDIDGIQQYMADGHVHRCRAEDLSHRLMTLPTHSSVKAADLQKMIEVFQNLQSVGDAHRPGRTAPELVTHSPSSPLSKLT